MITRLLAVLKHFPLNPKSEPHVEGKYTSLLSPILTPDPNPTLCCPVIRQRQKTKWSGGITDFMDVSLSKVQEVVKDRVAWHAAVHEVAKRQRQLRD